MNRRAKEPLIGEQPIEFEKKRSGRSEVKTGQMLRPRLETSMSVVDVRRNRLNGATELCTAPLEAVCALKAAEWRQVKMSPRQARTIRTRKLDQKTRRNHRQGEGRLVPFMAGTCDMWGSAGYQRRRKSPFPLKISHGKLGRRKDVCFCWKSESSSILITPPSAWRHSMIANCVSDRS